MKKYIILIFAIATLGSCKQNKTNTTDNNIIAEHPSTSVIEFEETIHDFGQIQAGEKTSYYFKFTNTGNDPLVLINVSASCGCTVIDYPKHPVTNNTTDSIQVEFTGMKTPGDFSKTITVQSNASNGTQNLQIKGHQL